MLNILYISYGFLISGIILIALITPGFDLKDYHFLFSTVTLVFIVLHAVAALKKRNFVLLILWILPIIFGTLLSWSHSKIMYLMANFSVIALFLVVAISLIMNRPFFIEVENRKLLRIVNMVTGFIILTLCVFWFAAVLFGIIKELN